MRNIEFKAKTNDMRRWVYGSLLRIMDKYFICYMTEPENYVSVCVNPDTICEYTGLIDNFYRDLYEWDIVEVTFINTDPNSSMKTHVVRGVIRYTNGGFDAVTPKGDEIGIFNKWYKKIDKVGNYYDNPELLQVD